MLYDEIIKIVTLAGELMLQAQDEELTVFDKEGTANFVTKHDKEIQFYLIRESAPAHSGGDLPCRRGWNARRTWRWLLLYHRSD